MSGYSSSYANDVIGLRGYENGSIAGNFAGTRNNAYAYSRLTLELRYPLMLETATSIYALAFAEAGNAWTDVNRMNPFKLKTSAGVGVRILLPMIGLMGIDWAYGFKKDRVRSEDRRKPIPLRPRTGILIIRHQGDTPQPKAASTPSSESMPLLFSDRGQTFD